MARTLEDGMLHEVSQTEAIRGFVTATDPYSHADIRHRASGAPADGTQTVGQSDYVVCVIVDAGECVHTQK